MARSSAGRPRAGKSDPHTGSVEPTDTPDLEATDAVELETTDAPDLEVDSDDEVDGDDEGEISRSKQADAFWTKFKIDPVEIALPGGAGYALRTYRMNTDVTPSDYLAREEDEFPDRSTTYVDIDDEFEDDALDEDEIDDELDENELDDDDLDDDDPDGDELDDDLDEDLRPGDENDDEEVAEEVPLFLSRAGHLLLFRSRAGLVDFIQSDAEHDLAQLKGWSRFADQLRPEYVVALPEDSYELDLIVKNLRSGHDTWDPDLIVKSGQIARDIGHALHLEPVVLAMSPGSPLDDLDEALRAVAAGGVGTFFARRKARKIGSETAAIGWRTVIGKISTVVDWRD